MPVVLFATFILLTTFEIVAVSVLFLTLPFSSKVLTCDACEKPIRLSAFLFRSKCDQCGSRHQYDAYLISAILILGNIFLVFKGGDLFTYAKFSLILGYLTLIFMIDFRYRYIFHKTTIPGFIAAVLIAYLDGKLLSSIFGAISGFLMMLAFYYLGVLYSKYKNRNNTTGEVLEEALGFGDVTLAGVLGALLGFGSVFHALFAGIFLAGAVSLILIAKMLIKKEYSDLFIAYGPYLIVASLPYLFI